MNRVLIYTADPCVFCRHAKDLLDNRGIPYDEVNLSKDLDGRSELAEKTGMMTFPQIIIDGDLLGGFQELAQADAAGKVADLVGSNA